MQRGFFALAVVACTALAGEALPGQAQAQAYQRIAPQPPQAGPAPTLAVPAPLPALPASTAPILPALRGVVFLADQSSLRLGGIPPSAVPRGISASGLPLLQNPVFFARIAPLLGKPVSFASLAAVQRLAQLWYIDHGHPFVDVTLPPQNIDSGVVQVVVTEYRVGAVTVAGEKWFFGPLLKRESGLQPGGSLTLNGLRMDLSVLNRNPFRTVNLVFQPGAATGTADVELRTQDRIPVHVYTTFDNQGVASLGRDEWGVGGTWGNVFGLDQLLSYQFTRSDLNRYAAHSLSWTIPLPWLDQILVFGAYATERPDIGPYFDETGHSGQASIRYVHDFPDFDSFSVHFSEDVQLGYDYKVTNNNLEFGGVSVFRSQAAIEQFPLIADLSDSDRFGQTEISNAFVISPGGLSGNNSSPAFAALEPGAKANYVYDNFSLTHTSFLPAGFSLESRVFGQLANADLLYSEQLGLGGANAVRGYVTDTALGSNGVLVSQEIRAPAFSLGGRWRLPDAEQLGAFWDYGHVAQVTPVPDAVNHADLASAGIDLHAGLGRYVSLSFDIGWQLRAPPGTPKRGAFTDLSVLVGY
jgi:hemolysin activation/secretion protein